MKVGVRRRRPRVGANLKKSKAWKRVHAYWSDKLEKMMILNQRLPSEAYGR
jgi:hypothetical protein